MNQLTTWVKTSEGLAHVCPSMILSSTQLKAHSSLLPLQPLVLNTWYSRYGLTAAAVYCSPRWMVVTSQRTALAYSLRKVSAGSQSRRGDTNPRSQCTQHRAVQVLQHVKAESRRGMPSPGASQLRICSISGASSRRSSRPSRHPPWTVSTRLAAFLRTRRMSYAGTPLRDGWGVLRTISGPWHRRHSAQIPCTCSSSHSPRAGERHVTFSSSSRSAALRLRRRSPPREGGNCAPRLAASMSICTTRVPGCGKGPTPVTMPRFRSHKSTTRVAAATHCWPLAGSS